MNRCIRQGCQSAVKAKGLCATHYQQARAAQRRAGWNIRHRLHDEGAGRAPASGSTPVSERPEPRPAHSDGRGAGGEHGRMTLEELRQLIQDELDRDEGMGAGDDAEDRGWHWALRWVLRQIEGAS